MLNNYYRGRILKDVEEAQKTMYHDDRTVINRDNADSTAEYVEKHSRNPDYEWVMATVTTAIAGIAVFFLSVIITSICFGEKYLGIVMIIGGLTWLTMLAITVFGTAYYDDVQTEELYVPAVNKWIDGAYRDSEWFQNLSASEQADVVAAMTSKTYRDLNGTVKELTAADDYDYSRALKVIDKTIAQNEIVSKYSDTTGSDENSALAKIIGNTRLLKEYRGVLSSGDSDAIINTDDYDYSTMSSDDSDALYLAIHHHNSYVKNAIEQKPVITLYENVLAKYRAALTQHPEYHDSHPSSKAIRDAETVAYSGFSM